MHHGAVAATETEHEIQAPYLVVGVERAWGTHCSCGWRLKLVSDEETAWREGRAHVEAATGPDQPATGSPVDRLKAWRQQRKDRYRGPERRN